jgi:ribonuclease HI
MEDGRTADYDLTITIEATEPRVWKLLGRDAHGTLALDRITLGQVDHTAEAATQAHAYACLDALNAARELGANSVCILTPSERVRDQLNRRLKVNQPALANAYDRFWRLAQNFGLVHVGPATAASTHPAAREHDAAVLDP